jgi:hypothetical protein
MMYLFDAGAGQKDHPSVALFLSIHDLIDLAMWRIERLRIRSLAR